MLALRRSDGRLRVLDQTLLPAREVWLELDGSDDVCDAIARLAVRGAPLIGIVAAHGLALQAERTAENLDAAADRLRAARPTAVNLAWAVDRVLSAAHRGGVSAARAEAQAIEDEQLVAERAIAHHGADTLAGARRILTHCNAGALACGGEHGTALGVIAELYRRTENDPRPDGEPVSVLVCETRPLLQGARLTTWELARMGIDHAVCVDGAAAGLIARGEVDAVVVGADRVAANGDVVNKVGTYSHALAAHAAGIPFVVACPRSTLDLATPDGRSITIEERDPAEVLSDHAPAGTAARNPAFDVTPAHLIGALVTEIGVTHLTAITAAT